MRRLVQGVLGAVLAAAVIGGLAGANASGASAGRQLAGSADHGVLQRFAPRSARTWWAIVASNLHAKTWLVRTTNSGRRWHTTTPPVKLIASSAFLGSKAAWIEADSLHAGAPGAPRMEPVYRTLDGGRSWQRLARVAIGCQLDFVDSRHGWCIGIGAAAGSEFVHLYRTSNGGSSWRLVSRTSVSGQGGSTPGALPFGCDKTIGFSSPQVGWAALTCGAGEPQLYKTSDGGARWHELAKLPLPKRLSTTGGGEMTLPIVHGSDVAVSLGIQSATTVPRVRTVIVTSANSGRTWRSRLVPGPTDWWGVDLVDARHWRLSDGATLLETNDAGRHWQRLKDPATLGSAVAPDFLSPRLGFALPDVNGFGGLWWTRDAGTTWKRITVKAGPFILR